jgi:tetratricopeptide (TPR) repeat protein
MELQTGHNGDQLPIALDDKQTKRIEAVHRGFLYQHLYAAGCLLLAEKHGVHSVTVERDEDIELAVDGRIYVQVKTRIKPIIPSDIGGAIDRFDSLRALHISGARSGKAAFYVVMNQPPGPVLSQSINAGEFPADVMLLWPSSDGNRHESLPPAWSGIEQAAEWCSQLATQLPFSLLAPESLVWKLAGRVQLASSGEPPYSNHTFHSKDLRVLFEQLIVRMQAFPPAPTLYRPQQNEPTFDDGERIKIVCAFSGAGKTSWASVSALHSASTCAYYDVGDLPGPAIATSLVRELAPLLIQEAEPEIRKVLTPGITGNESLYVLDEYIGRQSISALVVLDNAHRVPVDSLKALIQGTRHLKFVLLCHPTPVIQELEALLGLNQETLTGWDMDSIAAEAQLSGVKGSASTFKKLSTLTAGLPLFVQSAVKLAVSHYSGDLAQLCAEVVEQTNVAETAQEIILAKIFDGMPEKARDALAVWSLVDVNLSKDEICSLLKESLDIAVPGALALIKTLRTAGITQVIDAVQLRIHDSMRVLGRRHLQTLDRSISQSALEHLRMIFFKSLHERRDSSRLATLISVLLQLEDLDSIIQFAGEELFHEMGTTTEFLAYLEQIAQSEQVAPDKRFWALDGLVFAEVKGGHYNKLAKRFDQMHHLIEKNSLENDIQVSYYMKLMLHHAQFGRVDQANKALARAEELITEKPSHRRILRYNAATSFFQQGNHPAALKLIVPIIEEYFGLLGFKLEDFKVHNARELWGHVKRPRSATEDLKRLADALEVRAKLCTDRDAKQLVYRRAAFTLYEMVGAVDSQIRVGQDLADDLSARRRVTQAKQFMETRVIPLLAQHGIAEQSIGVRSQYAVFLAYCGDYEAAYSEMARLMPYSAGFTDRQLWELNSQLKIIHNSKTIHEVLNGGLLPVFVKGESVACPCGSGRAFDECHGTTDYREL